MNFRAFPLASCTMMLAFAGCASVPAERTESSTEAAAASEASTSTEETKSRVAAEPKRADSSTQPSSTAKMESDGPRSSWRAERETPRDTRIASASSSGNSDTTKLVEQLNDATRELATLRAANAKLRAERATSSSPGSANSSSATNSTAAAKPDPADEKLAASLKSYAQFRQEITNLFAELDRMRKENSSLSSNLKAAVEQSEQARANLARLETELRTERRSRSEAEHTVAQLRDQLRAVARALSSAGLSAEKLSAAETVGR